MDTPSAANVDEEGAGTHRHAAITSGQTPTARLGEEGDPRRQALRDYYGKITRLRRDTPVLRRGSFTTLATSGRGLAIAREWDGQLAVSLFNAGTTPVTITLSQKQLRDLAGAGADMVLEAIVGPDAFPRAAGASFSTGDKLDLRAGDLAVTLPGLSGAMLLN